MITVVLVDDEPLIRQGIAMILQAEPDIEVVAEAGDGAAGIEAARRTRPDVVVMDVRMPHLDGIRATELLLRADEPPAVLVLTTFGNDDYVQAALRVGAAGFLLKRSTAEQVVGAVRTVAAGESLVFPQQVRELLTTVPAATWSGPRPSDRELQVLALVAEGLTNAEIATELVIGVETVRSHVASLIAKLGARDRTNAVMIAWSHALLPRP